MTSTGGRPLDFNATEREGVVAFRWTADVPDTLQSSEPDVTPDRSRASIRARRPAPPATSSAARIGTAPSWPLYLGAAALSLLWAAGPVAFALGYRRGVAPLQDDLFALAVFTLLAVGPALLVFAAAFVVRQGQKVAAEAARARLQADRLLAPALVAASEAGDIAAALRGEVMRASQAAVDAQASLLALREALAAETDRLVDAAQQSRHDAQALVGALGQEREELSGLGEALGAQAKRVSEAIEQQTRMVADASDLAQVQLREAEAALVARTADLAAAAGEAGGAARIAAEDLTRQAARLEAAGAGVSEQLSAGERGLAQQREILAGLAEALKADNAAFADAAEAHAARLADFIAQARLSAVEMGDRATRGGESLRLLMSEAAAQFRDLTETARAEREAFGDSALHALDGISLAASEQRAQLEMQTRGAIEALNAAAEQTRAAAARHAEEARLQVEQLSEAAFTAGQKANEVFEKRLDEARSLVESSSQMVEDAGAIMSRKLQEGAAAARSTLGELEGMLTDLEQRATRLPVGARAQVEQVKASVAHGMDELMSQARRTAQEAQAIDAAFQERVRRNFEMLTEAVRVMGSVTAPVATAEPATAAQAARPAAPAPRAKGKPRAPASAAPENPADKAARPRLRLTPTATDEEFSQVFEAAGGQIAGDAPPDDDGETWTWKDLLASLDVGDADAERLEDTLKAELGKMGVGPGVLGPAKRIEEISVALQAGDLDGARQLVARAAPAATRRIGRRLFTDETVRRQTETYVRRFQTLADDAIIKDPTGVLLTDLLSGDAGRLYLLLDAAAGDLM